MTKGRPGPAASRMMRTAFSTTSLPVVSYTTLLSGLGAISISFSASSYWCDVISDDRHSVPYSLSAVWAASTSSGWLPPSGHDAHPASQSR